VAEEAAGLAAAVDFRVGEVPAEVGKFKP